MNDKPGLIISQDTLMGILAAVLIVLVAVMVILGCVWVIVHLWQMI